MEITENFSGGNIEVLKIDGNTVYLKNELRDTAMIGFTGRFA